MPNRKQDQGQGRENGGADRGIREQVESAAHKIQDEAQHAGQRLRENFDSAREDVSRRYRHAEGMMARNPASSVLIGFGVGFGLGLVLTTLLAHPEETWAERHIPDSLRHTPDSLHHLADALRHLPDAIARRMPSNPLRS